MDARLIEEVFEKEIDLIYLNLSDPWPKDRHAKRRLTSPVFLDRYSKIFKNNFNIIMKTDNIDLFNYSLESLKEYGYNIEYSINDLYSEDITDNIATEYEKKFVSKGIKINKLIATKKPQFIVNYKLRFFLRKKLNFFLKLKGFYQNKQNNISRGGKR